MVSYPPPRYKDILERPDSPGPLFGPAGVDDLAYKAG